ncbi:unnamed protein product [Allacma fusca]|uniref:Uncharacterized protein n=1 Tax=Allacma fusca TaxID=39272 RepID=A0A8J2KB19_9HEXA|nr:unnamed protein product [Allacma fusca]
MFYNNLVQEAFPEMMKSRLKSVVLHAKILNMGSPKALIALAIDPPKLSLVYVGRRRIYRKNHHHSCWSEYLSAIHTIVEFRPCRTCLSCIGLRIPSQIVWPLSTFTRLGCENLRVAICDFRKKDDEKVWANQYLVQRPVMREIVNLVKEIQRRLETMNIAVNENPSLELTEERGILLKIVIAGTFYPNYFVEISKELQSSNNSRISRFSGGSAWPLVSLNKYYFVSVQSIDMKIVSARRSLMAINKSV